MPLINRCVNINAHNVDTDRYTFQVTWNQGHLATEFLKSSSLALARIVLMGELQSTFGEFKEEKDPDLQGVQFTLQKKAA